MEIHWVAKGHGGDRLGVYQPGVFVGGLGVGREWARCVHGVILGAR